MCMYMCVICAYWPAQASDASFIIMLLLFRLPTVRPITVFVFTHCCSCFSCYFTFIVAVVEAFSVSSAASAWLLICLCVWIQHLKDDALTLPLRIPFVFSIALCMYVRLKMWCIFSIYRATIYSFSISHRQTCISAFHW